MVFFIHLSMVLRVYYWALRSKQDSLFFNLSFYSIHLILYRINNSLISLIKSIHNLYKNSSTNNIYALPNRIMWKSRKKNKRTNEIIEENGFTSPKRNKTKKNARKKFTNLYLNFLIKKNKFKIKTKFIKCFLKCYIKKV